MGTFPDLNQTNARMIMDIVGMDLTVVKNGEKNLSTQYACEDRIAKTMAAELEMSSPITTRKNVTPTLRQKASFWTMNHTCFNVSGTDGRYSG
jgi:hypothetical protein